MRVSFFCDYQKINISLRIIFNFICAYYFSSKETIFHDLFIMELCSNRSSLIARKIELYISNFTQLGQKQYLSSLSKYFFFSRYEISDLAMTVPLRKVRYLTTVINTTLLKTIIFCYVNFFMQKYRY